MDANVVDTHIQIVNDYLYSSDFTRNTNLIICEQQKK